MANVLIGIIGVILFIGLALAGALFLGPRFQESSNVSKASTIASGLSQIAYAVAMKQTAEGVTVTVEDSSSLLLGLKTQGYLKAVPSNPLGGEAGVVNELGQNTATPARWVYMSIGLSPSSKEVCRSIERNAGASDPSAYLDAQSKFDEWAPAHRRTGCFLNYYSNTYLAYAPI